MAFVASVASVASWLLVFSCRFINFLTSWLLCAFGFLWLLWLLWLLAVIGSCGFYGVAFLAFVVCELLACVAFVCSCWHLCFCYLDGLRPYEYNELG